MSTSNLSPVNRGANFNKAQQTENVHLLQVLVNKINNSSIKRIYSYVGEVKTNKPIYYEETILFKDMLQKIGIRVQVIEVHDDEITPEKWDASTSIFHVPGAMSTDLDLSLGDKVSAIRDFVNRGGKFLGWCGGAYWACASVEYRIDSKTSIEKTRDLAMWKGLEKGPLLPYLGNPEGNIGFFHGAVEVHWKGGQEVNNVKTDGLSLNVLLSGGGSFFPAIDEHPHKILASYKGKKGDLSNAAVKTAVGKGIAILVNPYFTHGFDYLSQGLKGYEKHFPSHNWKKIVDSLNDMDLQLQICFADMLLEFTKPLTSSEKKSERTRL